MNDIERAIEGKYEEENIKDEETKIRSKLNRNDNNDKKKKVIIYILIGVICLAVIGTIIFFILGKKDNSKENPKEETKEENSNIKAAEESNIGYVSCDDNTSPLNVRNSTNGDIIDSLSCFKEVTIEEVVEGTDNCDTWYKINYQKRGNNYTGYTCGTYIKKREVSNETIEIVEDLFEKANDYYENNILKAYCGTTDGTTKKIEFTDGNLIMTGEYLKSEYKTLEELKEYLLSFIAENLIDPKLELSDINNKKYYDSYYEIDGNLYCRNYASKGWLTYYTKNYDIEVTEKTENKITASIAYEYLNEDSNCDLDNLSTCPNSNFEYELGTIVIEKENDNFVITKMDFHK